MSSDDEADTERIADDPAAVRDGYVELILRSMRLKRISIRMLARKTGIGRSRLGLLLHCVPARRSDICLTEAKKIFDALDIDIFGAVICIEGFRDAKVFECPRYRAVIALSRVLFREFPIELVRELETLDDISDMDVRPEWAPSIQRGLVKRLIREISRLAAERASGLGFDL